MGAQTSNSSRDEEDDKGCSLRFGSSSSSSSCSCSRDSIHYQPALHISKKHRTSSSSMHLYRDPLISTVSSWNTVSRIQRYPEPPQHLRREVHAPCRRPRSFLSNSGRETHGQDNPIGIFEFLVRRYKDSKRLAYDTFKHFRNDNVVVDRDIEAAKDSNAGDSSVEEIEDLVSDDSGVNEVEDLISEDSSVEEVVVLSDEEEEEGRDATLGRICETYADANLHDDMGKMFESMTVNHGVEEDMGMLPYEKLRESAAKRNAKLDGLTYEIDLTTKKRLSYDSFPKKPVKGIYGEVFAPLTSEEKSVVSSALSNSNRRKILVTHQNSNIAITGESLQCLRPGGWLNDEVINVYLELLKEREAREPQKFLKCHFFNSFFYKKLISGRNGYDFNAVRRWTTPRKIDYSLFECDKIFVPIHKETHWCLAVINKKDKKFQYLDSLKGMGINVLHILARYYKDEVKDKDSEDVELSCWNYENVDDLPEQKNGFDCGMFMLKYADFYSRDLRLCFGQEDMPYFRERTALEILRLKAE